MRIRVLAPARAPLAAAAGDVVEVADALGSRLIAEGAAETTFDPVGPWVEPPVTGYRTWDLPDLQRECVRRGLPVAMRGPTDLIAALEASDGP